MTADPYPNTLAEIDDEALGFAAPDPIVVALNRIAVAIEHNTQALLGQRPQPVQNAPQRPANLAALPPVQVVTDKPVCPFHGSEKVRPSTKGQGGFYCSGQGGSGPLNTRGYCTWHS